MADEVTDDEDIGAVVLEEDHTKYAVFDAFMYWFYRTLADMTQLYQVIFLIDVMLKLAISVDHCTPNGKTALVIAVEAQDDLLVETLLACGANPNQLFPNGASVLNNAVVCKFDRIIIKLLEHGATVDASTLINACMFVRDDLVLTMIPRAGDLNVLVNGLTPLHYAAQFCSVEVARFMLEHEADVNYMTENVPYLTPLTCAACVMDTDMVEMLLSAGAIINPPRFDPILGCVVGLDKLQHPPPLMYGVPHFIESSFMSTLMEMLGVCANDDEAHIDFVRFLLERGADPHHFSLHDNYNVVEYAVFRRLSNVVELLIEYGVDPNAIRCRPHQSPLLTMAVLNVDLATVQVLVKNGALINDPTLEDLPSSIEESLYIVEHDPDILFYLLSEGGYLCQPVANYMAYHPNLPEEVQKTLRFVEQARSYAEEGDALALAQLVTHEAVDEVYSLTWLPLLSEKALQEFIVEVSKPIVAMQAMFAAFFDGNADDETQQQTEVFGPVAEELASCVVIPSARKRESLRRLVALLKA